jgi:hypothetical protein
MEYKNGRFVLPMDHQSLLNIISQLQSDRNVQLNSLREYVEAYLKFDGFRVIHCLGKNVKTNKQLQKHKVNREEERRNLRIDPKTTPLSEHEYTTLQDDKNYTLTERDHAAYEKGIVLNILGLDNEDYTSQIDKDLNERQQQSRLYRFIDLYIADVSLNQYDKEDDNLVTKRRHRTLHKKLFEDIIWRLFHVRTLSDAQDITIYQDELKDRMQDIIQLYQSQLKLIEIDVSAYKTYSGMVNRILSCIGVKLVSKRCRINGETRTRYYHIERESFERWLQYKTWYLSKSDQ